ncbi:hypothetical protein GGH17_006335 [Coemansia sp. RSA 788]|nr:hypothetical protein GGH17_006335 [Coemansia sp. RSA 788]
MGAVAVDPEKDFVPPSFTVKELRDCIPKHCFERNTLPALVFCASRIHALPVYLQAVAWVAYWVCQGVVCTGLWVIAHEW